MACLWEFGVLQHGNEINSGDTSFRHFTAYLSTSSAKVIKPVKSFVKWFCGHEGVQSSIAFLYFNLTDQNSSQNSLFRHNFSKPSASSQHKLQHRCFHLWYLPLFTTSLFYLLSGLHTCSIVLETKVEIAPLKNLTKSDYTWEMGESGMCY